MSSTTPQSVYSGCVTYEKSRIDFNNFNTFYNVKRIIIFLLLSLALSFVFLGITYLVLNYVLVEDIYADWYKVLLFYDAVICGCLSAYLIWKPKKF